MEAVLGLPWLQDEHPLRMNWLNGAFLYDAVIFGIESWKPEEKVTWKCFGGIPNTETEEIEEQRSDRSQQRSDAAPSKGTQSNVGGSQCSGKGQTEEHTVGEATTGRTEQTSNIENTTRTSTMTRSTKKGAGKKTVDFEKAMNMLGKVRSELRHQECAENRGTDRARQHGKLRQRRGKRRPREAEKYQSADQKTKYRKKKRGSIHSAIAVYPWCSRSTPRGPKDGRNTRTLSWYFWF